MAALVGAQSFEKFKDLVDEEMAKAEALVKGGVPAAKVYESVIATGQIKPPADKIAGPGARRGSAVPGPRTPRS